MYTYAIIAVTTILIILIGAYIVNKQLKKQQVIPDDKKSCDVYFFYTAWCPYCKKARIEWDKVKPEWGNPVNGYTIQFKEVDCDINERLAEKYKIKDYPTILMVKDGIVTMFDAKPTVDLLSRFLTTSFN